MGYYSEVTVEFYIEGLAPKDIYAKIKYDLKNDFGVLLYDLFDRVAFTHNAVILTAESVKWYETYKEVASFHKYISELGDHMDYDNDEVDEDDFNHIEGYIHFIRIGENYDDIEDYGWGNYWDSEIHVERYIEYDYVNEEPIEEDKD